MQAENGNAMGHVRVPLRISNPMQPELFVEINDALIDTGATWTCIPSRLVAEIGLHDGGPFGVRTASGLQEVRKSYATLLLAGQELTTNVLLSETLDTVLIGVTTLESLGLAVDPNKGQITQTEVLLL